MHGVVAFFLSKIHYAIVAKLFINEAKNEQRIKWNKTNKIYVYIYMKKTQQKKKTHREYHQIINRYGFAYCCSAVALCIYIAQSANHFLSNSLGSYLAIRIYFYTMFGSAVCSLSHTICSRTISLLLTY